MLRYLLILLFISCFAECIGQDTSFTLLWFKGKKLDDTTLLTPSGQTVSYSPSKGKANVITPAKNDIFNNVKKAVQNHEQSKADVDRQLVNIPHGRLLTGFIIQVNSAMDQAIAKADKLTETTIPLTEENLSRPPADPYEGSSIPAYLQQQYQDVLAGVDAIRKNWVPPPPPAPPSKDPDYCFPCDAQRQKKFKDDSASFMQYFSEENTGISKAFAVLGYFYFRKVKKLPYDTAHAWKMEIDMNDALQVFFRQIGRKLKLAWDTYNNDASKVEFLSQACLEHIRKQQLTGLPKFPGFPELPELVNKVIKATKAAFDTARTARNYKVLLNVTWYVGLIRMPALYGIEDVSFIEDLENFVDLSNFDVTIDAHAKLNKNGAIMYATMHGESVFSAVPDSNCLLKWTLVAPDSALMYYKLSDPGFQANGKTASYIGTYNWKSYPADFRLDFCRDDKDTAILFGFLPYKGEDKWMVDGRPVVAAIIMSIYTMSFMDIKRLQAIANDPVVLKRMHDEMMAKYEELKKNMPANKDPSQMTPQEIAQLNKAMNTAREMKAIVHPALPTSYLCRGHLVNLNKQIFSSSLNGKELFPENGAIQEAILTVKIEHKAK